MNDKIEFSLTNGVVETNIEYNDIKSLSIIVQYLSKHSLVTEIIKNKCREEDVGKFVNFLTLLGHTRPIIKPSEYK